MFALLLLMGCLDPNNNTLLIEALVYEENNIGCR
jgi:hypothetical protein